VSHARLLQPGVQRPRRPAVQARLLDYGRDNLRSVREVLRQMAPQRRADVIDPCLQLETAECRARGLDERCQREARVNSCDRLT